MARLFDKIPTVMKIIEKNTESRFSVWQVVFERSPAAGDTGCLELFMDIVVEIKAGRSSHLPLRPYRLVVQVSCHPWPLQGSRWSRRARSSVSHRAPAAAPLRSVAAAGCRAQRRSPLSGLAPAPGPAECPHASLPALLQRGTRASFDP